MKKILVFASSYGQFINFCRNFNLNRNKDVKYVLEYAHVCGWWIDQPVVLLEGYEYNPNYTVKLMHYIGCRFEDITFVSEGEMWDEGIKL